MRSIPSKILMCTVVMLLASLSTFGQGEWEFPEQQNGGNGNEPVEVDESVEANGEDVKLAEVTATAETEIEEGPFEPPRIDLFPVIHVDEASKPRPRNPKKILDWVDTDNLAVKLEADRLLLGEIRKDVPEAIEEAVPYLERLKDLSKLSDPVRLVPLFDRVLDQAPIYFTWLETEYESQDEQITEYYVGGARGFAFAMENFKSAVFFVIMNRLDIASRVISQLGDSRQ